MAKKIADEALDLSKTKGKAKKAPGKKAKAAKGASVAKVTRARAKKKAEEEKEDVVSEHFQLRKSLADELWDFVVQRKKERDKTLNSKKAVVEAALEEFFKKHKK